MKIFTFTGPSGSGKDSIVDAVLYLANVIKKEYSPFVTQKLEELDSLKKIFPKVNLRVLVSHTTRAPRPGERDGINYYFVTKEEMEKIDFVEYTEYSGNFYGLSKKEISTTSYPSLVVVDIEGVHQIKKFHDDTFSFFIKTTPDIIKKRMEARGDSEEKIKERLLNAIQTNEYNNGKYCDYIVENNDFIKTVEEVYKVILDNII